MKTLTEKRFFKWEEDDVSVTLRGSSASYGGGVRGVSYLLYQRTVGSLQYDDYKGTNRQYVEQDKCIVMAYEDSYKP